MKLLEAISLRGFLLACPSGEIPTASIRGLKAAVLKRRDKGSVLIICLWILTILIIFATGASYRARRDLGLAYVSRDTFRAYLLAESGINQGILEVVNGKAHDSGSEGEVFIISDEEGKININAAGKILLSDLLIEKGFSSNDADTMSDIIIRWRGGQIEGGGYFEVTAGLVPVLEYFYKEIRDAFDFKAQAQEAYFLLEDAITVYGESGRVNINTASEEVLKVIGLNALDELGGIDIQDTDVSMLVAAIISYRQAYIIKAAEIDTENLRQKFGFRDLLSDNRSKILDKLIAMGLLAADSDYFRIEARGKFKDITKNITAIYRRSTNRIVYWHEA